jgi:hypothetical protein
LNWFVTSATVESEIAVPLTNAAVLVFSNVVHPVSARVAARTAMTTPMAMTPDRRPRTRRPTRWPTGIPTSFQGT